jgi:hypothetical protein
MGQGLAAAILALHLLVIAFNVVGMVIIPIGAWRHWTFVRAALWRFAHVVSMAAVAVQAVAGRACFLTLWQDQLSGARGSEPLIVRTVNALVFWPLPAWMFTALYVVLFAYVLALLVIVPPRLSWR